MKQKLLILSIAALLSSCGGSLPEIGSHITVKEDCLSATTEQAYSDMTDISRRKDEQALRLMMAAGEAFVIPANKVVTLSKIGTGKSLVTATIGGQEKQLWIANENLK